MEGATASRHWSADVGSSAPATMCSACSRTYENRSAIAQAGLPGRDSTLSRERNVRDLPEVSAWSSCHYGAYSVITPCSRPAWGLQCYRTARCRMAPTSLDAALSGRQIDARAFEYQRAGAGYVPLSTTCFAARRRRRGEIEVWMTSASEARMTLGPSPPRDAAGRSSVDSSGHSPLRLHAERRNGADLHADVQTRGFFLQDQATAHCRSPFLRRGLPDRCLYGMPWRKPASGTDRRPSARQFLNHTDLATKPRSPWRGTDEYYRRRPTSARMDRGIELAAKDPPRLRIDPRYTTRKLVYLPWPSMAGLGSTLNASRALRTGGDGDILSGGRVRSSILTGDNAPPLVVPRTRPAAISGDARFFTLLLRDPRALRGQRTSGVP